MGPVMRMHLRWAVATLALTWACTSGCGAPEIGPGDLDQGMPPEPQAATATSAGHVRLPELPSDPREPTLAKTLVRLLAERHLERRPLDDELSRRAFAIYLKSTDSEKLFLLREHAASLEAHAEQMDDQMRSGDLSLSRQGAGVLAQRRALVAEMVADLLRQPFDFELAEHVETDGEKRAFCATEDALRDRWRRLLKLQVLQRDADEQELTAGHRAAFEISEKRIRGALAKSLAARFSRLANLDSLEPAERFFNAIATAYDPHTRYLAPAAQTRLDVALTGALQGIGASLGEQGPHFVIVDLLIGSAGWNHGELEVGDVLLAVAQPKQAPVMVSDLPLERVAGMLRGPAGTIVTLRVRKSDDAVKNIAITRAATEVEAAYARGAELDLGPAQPAVGYVYLPSFYDKGGTLASDRTRNATADVRRFLQTFEKRKLGGLVLDLRGNRGGLIEHAQHIAGLLIHKGPVVQTRSATGKLDTLSDIHPFATFNGQVVVLVDRFSASASEVLAAALQDHHRALVVGTGSTYGKGTVQELVDLDRLRFGAAPREGKSLGLLVLTIQQNFRIDGTSTQLKGMRPDVLLPDPAAHFPDGERAYPHAIPFRSIAPIGFKPHQRAWNPKALAQKSALRTASNAVFKTVEARGEVLIRRKRSTRVPLRRTEWSTRRSAEKTELDALRVDLRHGSARFGVRPVEQASLHSAAKAGGRQRQWNELARDPWVEECVRLLLEMRPGG